jgi:hypothetical protein
LKVVDSPVEPADGRAVIVLASAEEQMKEAPKQIITNSHQDDAVLLRVY